jgi:hypothetical protein
MNVERLALSACIGMGLGIGMLVSACTLYLALETTAHSQADESQAGYLSERSPAFKAIRSQLDTLSQSVAVVSRTSNETAVELPVDSHIMSKLKQMEARLAELESTVSEANSDDSSPGDARNAHAELVQSRPIEEYRPSNAGASAFEVDNGTPLGSYSDIIYDSFHEIADIVQLHDFQCKQSICKIAYSGNGEEYDRFSESEHPGTLVIDKLSDNMGETSLDIRFSREAGGNQVMYVQLR